MSCSKHPVRKRKDCPECFPDIENLIADTTKELEEISEEVEKIEEVVINKAAPEIEVVPDPILEQEVKFVEAPAAFDLDGYLEFKEKEYLKKINDAFAIKFKEMQKEVSHLLKIKYDHIDIPLTVFNMKVMDTLSRDGWKLVHILTKEVAKVSGLREDSAVMQRVVSAEWKHTTEQVKEKYKSKG
jgi:hypothetical protein